MSHSTGTARKRKPRVQSPPWQHPNGQWAKKIKGEVHYFGPVSTDPSGAAALRLWAAQDEDLRAEPAERVDEAQSIHADALRLGGAEQHQPHSTPLTLLSVRKMS